MQQPFHSLSAAARAAHPFLTSDMQRRVKKLNTASCTLRHTSKVFDAKLIADLGKQLSDDKLSACQKCDAFGEDVSTTDVDQALRAPLVRNVEVQSLERLVCDVAVQSTLPEVTDAACFAEAQVINRETEQTMPDAAIRAEWQDRVDAHTNRYPGGKLPCELRSYTDYREMRNKRLSATGSLPPRCQFCGKSS